MKKRLVAPFFAGILLVVAGCGEAAVTLPGLTLTPSPTIYAGATAPITVQYCTDDTGSYNREYFKAANDLVAKSLIHSVLPDAQGTLHASQGLELFATLITSHTFDPRNSLPPFEVPASTPPHLPPLQPTPTPGDPDQFHAHTIKGTVDDANAATIARYNAAMSAYLTQLKSTQASVTADVQRLQTWDPPVDEQATSIWGCLALATTRLAGKAGPKYLIIASDMENNTCVDCATVQLSGVTVHVIFFQSDNAIRAQQKEQEWTAAFVQAGVHPADIAFDDPAASQPLLQAPGAPLFGG